ncbi:MAG: MXAN_6640 family putative metalloprotease, partial [Myxococcota bacterium]
MESILMRILGTTGDEQVKLSRATSTTKAFAPHHQRASSLFRWGSVAALNIGLLACAPSPDYDDGGDFPRIITSSNGLRPTDLDAILPRFAATDQVRTLETTNFKVHFSTNGPNAIPTNDADATGEPDYAEFVLDTFEASLVAYSQLGFRSPLNDAFVSDGDGGDGKFDVYLIDFGGRGDGQYRLDACLAASPNRCAGHMLLENDFAGYGYPSIETAIRIVGSHELFHAVQAGYAAGQDLIVSEATAVWATERFDPTLNDFEAFIRRFLERPERSIFVAPSGLVDGYPYSVSLFFRFLDERFGPEIVLELWQQLEQTPDVDDWVASVDGILSANYGTGFTDEYEEFAVWNVY